MLSGFFCVFFVLPAVAVCGRELRG